jgi:hypothetical protein
LIGPGWLSGVFALLSLAVAGVMMAVAPARRGDRSACLAHAAMALGMAGMFAPWGDPVPGPVGAVVFAVVGAWFAARWLRRGEQADDDALHLVVGPAAMIVMYLGMDHHAGAPTPAGEVAGHVGHGSALAAGGGGPVLAALLLALAAYFVWHAWATAPPSRAVTTAGWSPVRVGHVVMSSLMAVMLLGGL